MYEILKENNEYHLYEKILSVDKYTIIYDKRRGIK